MRISSDRFFVRAFVETGANDAAQQPPRYGFTNPIWLMRSPVWHNWPPAVEAPIVRPPTRPVVTAERDRRGQLTVEFIGVLQHAQRLGDPFVDVPGAVSPYVVPAGDKAGFFRARK